MMDVVTENHCRKPTTIELFAGAGGLALGVEEAGFETLGLIEFDKDAADTLKLNRPNWRVIHDDIANISKLDLEEYFSIKRGELDLLSGGAPCQSFSYAGNRLGLEDARGTLFYHYAKFLNKLQPKMFLFENVKGLRSHDKGRTYKTILSIFEQEGYTITENQIRVLNAWNYGVPQKRERVVVIGSLNKDFDIDALFEKAKAKVSEQDCNFFNPVTLQEAISDIPDVSESGMAVLLDCTSSYQASLRQDSNTITNHKATKHNNLAVRRMSKIETGENWQSLEEDIHSVHSGAYGRLDWTKPTMTITTRFDTPAGGRFIHPDKDRTLTPREAARVQSFPDSFEFIGSKTSVCKQIGNAVPPKLAYFLAHVVDELI